MIRKLIPVSVLAIIVCLTILSINSCSISSAFRKFNDEEELRRAADWQQIVIFDVIDKHTPDIVSEDAIKKEYLEAASKLKNINISTSELPDAVLKRHLIELQGRGLIRREKDGYSSTSADARP